MNSCVSPCTSRGAEMRHAACVALIVDMFSYELTLIRCYVHDFLQSLVSNPLNDFEKWLMSLYIKNSA